MTLLFRRRRGHSAGVCQRDENVQFYRLSARLGMLTVHIPPGNHNYEDFEVQLDPRFHRIKTKYEDLVPYATDHLTVLSKALSPVDRVISREEDADRSKTGRQVKLKIGNNTIAFTVTNKAGNRTSPNPNLYRRRQARILHLQQSVHGY